MANYDSSIIVTGGTQGMGYHASLDLARRLPNTLIVVASRTDAANSAATINRTLKQSNVKYLPLDLTTLAKVRAFVQSWKEANHPPIRALLLNAGMQLPGAVEWTEDGVEKTFAISHLGHALLFHLLAPYLTRDARIVVTASGVHDPAQKLGMTPHYTTAEEAAKPGKEAQKLSNGRDRYATSKAANVIWTRALARHFALSPASRNRTVVALDPGLMLGTGLARNAAAPVRLLWKVGPSLVPVLRKLVNPNIHHPEESGKTLAWLAVDEEVRGKTGVYYEQRKEIASSVQSKVEATQEELWRWTIDFTATSPEEKERFERIE